MASCGETVVQGCFWRVRFSLLPPNPAVLKTLRDSELLRRSVFTTPPPYLLRCEPFFERRNVCNSHQDGVRTRCATIVNHYAVVNSLRE